MTDIWRKLEDNHKAATGRSIVSLFDDPARFETFSAEADGLLVDVSKTNIDRSALSLLVQLAEGAGVAARRDAMFAGEKINTTEQRAVLHTALRADETAPLFVDGADVRPRIAETLQRMEAFADGVRAGEIRASGGELFSDIVNIGIGGSDLGPAMATQALRPYHNGPRCHFVSNIDGAQISGVLGGLDPKTTLIIISSKTFTTVETMTNAKTALAWLRDGIGAGASDHLAAVSTALDLTASLRIAPERVFGFADWVGGRYSLWGPVGLSIMLAVGPENFRAFLAGGAAMDRHFCTAPFARNLPVLMGMVGIWHRNICRYHTRAVLPYDQNLARLPAYIQQLDMESNGKRVSIDGTALTRSSGPVVWGEAGTNGQHAFYQLLHQGADVIPTEFLIAAEAHEPKLKNHHDRLKANCLAQTEALMVGRTYEQALKIAADLGFEGDERNVQAAHRTFPGDKPSVTLAYDKVTPFTLGQIIALYEHRVFVEGVIWGLNSFDQWGVELGKELANALLPIIKGGDARGKDGSTVGLVRKLVKA
ncbi:MAG: glucose-6-phosphate isomerase [Pikeienuella sp.]